MKILKVIKEKFLKLITRLKCGMRKNKKTKKVNCTKSRGPKNVNSNASISQYKDLTEDIIRHQKILKVPDDLNSQFSCFESNSKAKRVNIESNNENIDQDQKFAQLKPSDYNVSTVSNLDVLKNDGKQNGFYSELGSLNKNLEYDNASVDREYVSEIDDSLGKENVLLVSESLKETRISLGSDHNPSIKNYENKTSGQIDKCLQESTNSCDSDNTANKEMYDAITEDLFLVLLGNEYKNLAALENENEKESVEEIVIDRSIQDEVMENPISLVTKTVDEALEKKTTAIIPLPENNEYTKYSFNIKINNLDRSDSSNTNSDIKRPYLRRCQKYKLKKSDSRERKTKLVLNHMFKFYRLNEALKIDIMKYTFRNNMGTSEKYRKRQRDHNRLHLQLVQRVNNSYKKNKMLIEKALAPNLHFFLASAMGLMKLNNVSCNLNCIFKSNSFYQKTARESVTTPLKFEKSLVE